jgi:hypothetical protein
VPPVNKCGNCGARIGKTARFCPQCGERTGLDTGETIVQELPPEETGPVPVQVVTAEPRFFGVTPPAAVLALAAVSLAFAVALLVLGHVVVGGVLLVVAGLLLLMFAGLARRLPETRTAKVSRGTLTSVRARAGYAYEAIAAQSSARVDLFRLRRELAELVARRAECARTFGEAVYAGASEESESARQLMAELDGLIAAKEEQMQQTVAGALERIDRGRLEVQPTMVEAPEPAPMPEPLPSPSEPPAPVPVPEPTPEPSEPPGPVRVPEPGPEPSPPATPQG